MARKSTNPTLDDIMQAALEPVIQRAVAVIRRAFAEMTDARAPPKPGPARAARNRGRTAGRARRRRSEDIAKWTADRRARRVPIFVIESTGLDTKKKIVAKFGADVTFERGKPLPKPKGDAAPTVTAKPPRVRKAAASA